MTKKQIKKTAELIRETRKEIISIVSEVLSNSPEITAKIAAIKIDTELTNLIAKCLTNLTK